MIDLIDVSYTVTVRMQDDIDPEGIARMIHEGVQNTLGHDQGIANVVSVALTTPDAR